MRWFVLIVASAVGVVAGYFMAFLLWSLVANGGGEEPGGLGLIWLFCIVTIPLSVWILRQLAGRVLRR